MDLGSVRAGVSHILGYRENLLPTASQEHFSDHEWHSHLQSYSPHFDVLPIGALVPQDYMAGYIEAGGTPFP